MGGFLLKLVAAIVTAAFGVLGIGAKTRNEAGALTRSGWVALIGLLIAALVAIGASVYDFVSGQAATRGELIRYERLMLSVQRNLYPLRGLTVSFTVVLDGVSSIDVYKAELRRRISQDPFCKHERQAYGCAPLLSPSPNHPEYAISGTSPLFPTKGSALGKLLDQLYFMVGIAKSDMGTSEPKGQPTAKWLGHFEVDVTGTPRKRILFLYNYDQNVLRMVAYAVQAKDDFVARSDVYSLVDFFLGYSELRRMSV